MAADHPVSRRIVWIRISGLLLLALLLVLVSARLSKPRAISFAECERRGGEPWLVDLYHPDICPDCAAFRSCQEEYDDYRETCPECYGACQDCQERYSVSESCPECYGPCQDCANRYLNNFESVSERNELCPVCEVCDTCREEVENKRINCPPCVSCKACKQENKRYAEIGDVCPQVDACNECLESNYPFPERCPGGKYKIGEISDTAIWFQCCK